MSPTIRYKYKYFHFTVQRTKDRRQKFHFCRLPFAVQPRNVKLNLSNVYKLPRRQTDRFILRFTNHAVFVLCLHLKASRHVSKPQTLTFGRIMFHALTLCLTSFLLSTLQINSRRPCRLSDLASERQRGWR